MEIAYKTTATATGGRDGRAKTADGSLDLKLSTPKELGGGGGDGNNPEQLFAAGYSACFLGALKYVAGQEKMKIPGDARVTATVGIGPRDDGKGFGIDVDLEVSLPGLESDDARELVDKAHVVCPYSHATKGNIDVRTTISQAG
ncbi:MAG: organic hydroperoxide resistance protein [Gammaproteobacteria bacterium]|nr:organic hydroperoxide resistance protein [Gammaproteobacteria bacterium]